MANEKITAVGTNIQEKATMIWNVADVLRGPFKPHEYGLVILPMTVVKRFHDCLLPTHQAVLDTYEKVKKLAVTDGFLRRASGYQFYNTSKYTFDRLLADPENIESNFRDYLNGFSANVQDVLAKFDFENIIKRMVDSNTLYLVIKEFGSQKGYLGPDKISTVDCGYIFEDLVRRFSESFGEEAGAHFTSRDIIYLMTDLLLSGADLHRQENVTVYDMTMGTSQMLSCMEERIHEINPDMEVTCFGQEFNPSTFAIAKADMMIRGGNPENMRFGDTLSEDQFPGYTFRYIISNPPFGIDWKREQDAVKAEADKGDQGRFAAGLPKISDGQQLFVLNGLAKLNANGKMAIIQDASSLYVGDAGSGPSNIRQYILENDWLDAIVRLSTNQFMNTGIGTYIWLISKNKPEQRAGKVQLIDATHCFEPRRRPIGKKRSDITDICFQFNKRILAYFCVDLNQAWMTTKLAGEHTYFLPFNQGSNGAGNDGGKGNPANPDGYPTDYLWKKVFQADSMMDIIQKFISLQGDRLIFPRYHQMDVVRKLISDVKTNGVGNNYLIQHSAGSGKSNSIAWLAYGKDHGW